MTRKTGYYEWIAPEVTNNMLHRWLNTITQFQRQSVQLDLGNPNFLQAAYVAWNMFPSHVSVTDFGIFALVAVFGLIVTLLFLFDFVSTQVTVHVFFAGRILDS